MGGGGLLVTRTAATVPASKKLSKLKIKKRSSSFIQPNLKSMYNRNSSRSFSRTMSDSLISIEEPLCAYLSLFDGTKKELKDVQIHIDNLFSDNFVHMMDGDKPIDKTAFIQINKQMLQQGVVATLEDIYSVDEYTVEYTVHWYYNEYSSRVTHVSALVIDRKIVKVEPCIETRSAFANNMRFPSWKNGRENRMSSSSSSSRTTRGIDEAPLTPTTVLPDSLVRDQEKKALVEKVVNRESSHNTLNSNSTMESISLQELSMVHEEEDVNEMKPSCDEVEVKQDEKGAKTGNNHSDDQVLKGIWVRVRGLRRKNEVKSSISLWSVEY